MTEENKKEQEEIKDEAAPAEEVKEEAAPEVEAAPAEEVKEEAAPAVAAAPAEAAKEEVAPAEEAPKKGPSNQPKETNPPKPTECASCAKALLKKLWYYRNDAFYCTKQCYKRKLNEDRKKASEEKAKAEEAAKGKK